MDPCDQIAQVAMTYDLRTLVALRAACRRMPDLEGASERAQLLLLLAVASDAGIDADVALAIAQAGGLEHNTALEFVANLGDESPDARLQRALEAA